jgi:hypothetical protein
MTLFFDPRTSEVSLTAGAPAAALAVSGRLGADVPVKIVVTDPDFDGAQSNEFQFIAKRPGDALGPAAVQETGFVQFGSALEWNGHLALRGPVLSELVDGNNPVTLEAQLQLVLASKVLVSQLFTLNVAPTLFAITSVGSLEPLLPTARTRLGSDGSLQISPDGVTWSVLTIDAEGIVTTIRVP